MAHAILRSLTPFLFPILAVRTAAAAPDALLISETPLCRVSLTKLSYDGPGADDEEFVEIFVERTGDAGAAGVPGNPADAGPAPPPCGMPHGARDARAPTPDATTRPDGALDGQAGGLTLGDCGLGELRLVSGGAGTCDEYRVIPLASVAVPTDGFVVLCATDSLFSGACDVSTAGRSALRNGFLQNGPTDGLRFLDASDSVTLELAYEGTPACFSPGVHTMVAETGEAAVAPGVDDVNVACGGRFVLLPASEARLREPSRCTTRSADAGMDAAPLVPTTPLPESGPAARPPEFVPDTGLGYSPFSIPDAAFAIPERPKGVPFEPPSCRASAARGNGDPVLPAVVTAAVLASLKRRRRRRLPPALRVSYFAHSETGLRRSP
jgi:hypothetical protein